MTPNDRLAGATDEQIAQATALKIANAAREKAATYCIAGGILLEFARFIESRNWWGPNDST